MDPDKVLKFLVDNFNEWARVTYLTLIRPVSRFELVQATNEPDSAGIIGSSREAEIWLSPKLISFAAVSALLGIAMNSLLPNRIPSPQLFSAVAIVFALWFLYGSLAHLLCIFLRGSGKYLQTVSVSLQVSATLYVVVSFLALVFAAAGSVSVVATALDNIPIIGRPLIEEPALWFFVLGTVLASIYQPLALRRVHNLGWFRTVFVGLLPYAISWLSVVVYHRTGVMAPPPAVQAVVL